MAMKNSRASHNQSGNVFLIILVGIVLFAALMFTFSRGVTQGTSGMAGREAELAASDIVAYGQQMQRATERLIARGISEEDISFDNIEDTNYVNPACTDNRCLIFHPEGGSVRWETPPDGINYTSATYFIGPNRVGSADGTTANIGTAARDLVLMLPVNKEVCDAINAQTSKIDTWANASTSNRTTRFIGNYDAAAGTVIARANENNQPPSGCFCEGSLPCSPATEQLYYYHVLYAR